jgi:hydroxymethylbilane synthase
MLPAVGQGALGLECRADDARARALLEPLNDPPTRAAVLAERALLRGLGGGCQVPVGASTAVEGDRLTLRGVVIDVDGRRRVEASVQGAAAAAEELGQRLAEQLLAGGAQLLLGA